jgi:hypothetical protein
MSTSSCVFHGRTPVEMHHVTGRSPDGTYFDTALIVPMSPRQHVIEHQGWRAIGIGEDASLDPRVLRLRRAGHILVRLSEHHGEEVVALPAQSVRQLGLMLHQIADDWDGM